MATYPTSWADRPEHIQSKIKDVETELDAIWPGWRDRKPFDKVEYDLKARIKWLLKRHSLLTHTENGQPAPLDWDVMIARDLRDPKKCYAHPVIPARAEVAEVTRNPPSPLAAARPAGPLLEAESASSLAGRLGVALNRVERALAHKPSTWKDSEESWVARYLQLGVQPRNPTNP